MAGRDRMLRVRRFVTIGVLLTALFAAERARASRPRGIDVSSYQGSGINWTSVKNSGVVFAWAKATEGQTINDADFTVNESHGKSAGVYMGAYHFAHPELHSPSVEASHFWSIAGAYIKADGKTLMPMLDMEVFSGVVGASSYSDWANQWCNIIKNNAAAAGVKTTPVIYVSACNANHLSGTGQWYDDIADYNGESSQSGTPWSVCSGYNVWGTWNFWQYTSSASVPGVSGGCDADVFNGTLSDLTSTMLATSTAVNDASVVSSSVPSSVQAGASFSATVKMKNSGTTSWSSGGTHPYRLGSQSPQDNTTWGLSRVNLPSSPVSAGSSITFTINATAPTGLGNHTFAWKMVQEGVEWFGSTFSSTISVTAIPPTITTQPASQTRDPGQTAAFSVAASGTTPFTYQWKKNGANLANGGNISGATSSALSLSNVQLSDAANYTVVVGNSGGSVTSQVAALTVSSTPSPVGTGVGLKAVYYDTATFTGSSITRTDATVNFNWGTNSPAPGLSGDTFSARWTGKVEPRYSQVYTFYTTSDDGARLWVNGILLIDKFINQSATEWSGTIALTAGQQYDIQMDYYENTGVASAQLSWSSASQAKQIIPQTQLYPTQPSSSVGPIPGIYNTGVNSNYLLLPAGTVDPHYQLITSADGGYPGPDSFVVNEGYPIPPWLTNGPYSKWIAPLAAESAGNPPGDYTYRLTFDMTGLDPNSAVINGNWSVDNSGVDLLLNGVSTSKRDTNGWTVFTAFTIDRGFVLGTNTLDFVINNSGTSANPTGLRVELSGVTAQGFPAAIVEPPQGLAVNQGGSATFSVGAAGTPPLSYQWFFDGGPIDGATGTSYTRTNVQPADAGNYSVVVSNAFGTATSSDAALAVNLPPAIDAQPQDQVVNQSDNATFSISASGTSPLNYQWMYNGQPIIGATDAAYTRSSVQAADEGDYSVLVTNVAGSISSSNAALFVIQPPSIIIQPQSQTVVQGNEVTFTVIAGGTAPAYQWLFNGDELFNDPGSNSYTVASAQLANAGVYSVVVSNSAGIVASSNAILIVHVPPYITNQPEGLTVLLGATVSFSVGADGTLPLSYQWQLNGTTLTGATASSLTLSNVTLAQMGSYSVRVDNSFGSVTSAPTPLSLSLLNARMDWYTVDGGGGVTTNDPWSFAGTIGQPDAGRLSSGTWTMQGGFWGDGTAMVSTVNATNIPPDITTIRVLSNGVVALDGKSAPNQLYYVQVATNLTPPVFWVNIVTNHADGGGLLLYLDSSATNFTTRFYRFVSP